MFQWVRNYGGRLVKVSLLQNPEAAVILNVNQMKPPPKEQQSPQPMESNPNAYRSMMDYKNPPRISVPSCMVPPTTTPYGNVYNPSWRNHLSLSWGPEPIQYSPPPHPHYASSS